MERTYIKDIKKHTGKKILLSGFVQTLRKQGGIAFLILRDVTGTVQTVIIKSNTDAFATIQDLSLESVVTIVGESKENPQAPNGIEVLVETIEVLSKAEPELPIPVDEKGESETNLDTRLDWRYLDLRKERNALIFKVWTLMDQVFTDTMTDKGFIQIHSPKLMNTASESGAEVFEVNYFERKAYLSQSPQFYKQMAMASGFEKVFEIGPVFRADPSFTSRHATEFTGYDLEVSFIKDHHEVMDIEESIIVAITSKVNAVYGKEIKAVFNREIPVPTSPFPRITFAKVKEILKEKGIKSEKPADLTGDEEKGISQYVLEKYGHEFVFITDYPIEGRPFYHMRYADKPDTTMSFDLLWNGLEVTTGAQREHRYDILKAQATEKGLTDATIGDYLNFFRYGCPPHGGLGAGPSRFIMKMLGVDNIREATYLYRGVKRLTP
ncbi:MAG: aspartate--tRNA(Asn) ligase [Microgenomates group bacterium]